MRPSLAGLPERLRAAILRGARGETPPNVALMQVLIEAAAPEEAEAALAEASAALAGGEAERVARMTGLLRENPQAFGIIKSVLASVDHGDASGDWAGRFDRAAGASPDGSAALYALGNPSLLRAATVEVVEAMRGWGLLGSDRRALEIGCGSGRFLEALSPELARVVGLDVSGALVEEARRRCAGLPNVEARRTEGRDLSGLADGSFDLVLAVDSFPYLVEPNPALARRHLDEAARVLRRGGHLLLFNYSYRGDPERDRRDVAESAEAAGFEVLRAGTRDLALWDGAAFLLRRN